MSALSDKQALFPGMVGALFVYAAAIGPAMGYQIRLGYGYRDPVLNAQVGGHPRSLHKLRLAQDVQVDRLVDSRWRWQKKLCPFHEILGAYWKSLGGDWGGDFEEPDPSHFSLGHRGMR